MWSPSGSALSFRGQEKTNRWALWRLDVGTGDISLLLRRSGMRDHQWSADRTQLYYDVRSWDGPFGIFARNMETGVERPLFAADTTGPDYMFHSLQLSPDGKSLAMISYWHDALLLMPTTGGPPWELLQAPEGSKFGAVTWTADGRYLVYTKQSSDEKKPTELWRVPVAGGEPVSLGIAVPGLVGVRVHPDGRRIAFTAGESRMEVWVMEDFLPESPAIPDSSQ